VTLYWADAAMAREGYGAPKAARLLGKPAMKG
jgi:hypothetical protein